MLTLEEISRQLNVSTKTISRWRKRGLIGLPVLYNGRRQVGFLPSLVDPFLTANKRAGGARQPILAAERRTKRKRSCAGPSGCRASAPAP